MAQNEASGFDQLNIYDGWNFIFKDKCTKDYTKNWKLDGLIASVTNSKNGMLFKAGQSLKMMHIMQ